jgi:hypothetical protein
MSGSMIYLYLKTLDFIARYLGYIIVAESIIALIMTAALNKMALAVARTTVQFQTFTF